MVLQLLLRPFSHLGTHSVPLLRPRGFYHLAPARLLSTKRGNKNNNENNNPRAGSPPRSSSLRNWTATEQERQLQGGTGTQQTKDLLHLTEKQELVLEKEMARRAKRFDALPQPAPKTRKTRQPQDPEPRGDTQADPVADSGHVAPRKSSGKKGKSLMAASIEPDSEAGDEGSPATAAAPPLGEISVASSSTVASVEEPQSPRPVEIKRRSPSPATAMRRRLTQNPHESREVLEELMLSWERIKPGVEVIDSLLHVLMLHEKYDEVESVLALIRERGLAFSGGTYAFAIRLACARGDVSTADAQLAEASDRGLVSLRTISPLIAKYAELGNLPRTFALFREIEQRNLNPDDALVRSVFLSLRQTDDIAAYVDLINQGLRKHATILEEASEKEATELLTARGWTVKPTTIHQNGKCNCCSSQLEPPTLDEGLQKMLRSEMQRMLERTKDVVMFSRFQKWLKKNGPFDVIVDGLNVAFAGTGTMVPGNISKVVNHFEALGHRVAVLAKAHVLTYEPLRHLQFAGRLFCVDESRLDDLYWIYAAVEGGLEVQCITNDKMRDHARHLDPSKIPLFVKWKMAHRVEFEFAGKRKDLVVHPRAMYYTISQISQEDSVNHWHLPCDGDKWLCCTKPQ